MKNYSPYFGEIIVNENISPIIVFSVGKVASKTVTESIYALEDIPYSVYHAHVLSPKILNFNDIDSQEKNFTATNDYLGFNLKLSKFVNENLDNYQWKVITLVREPLSIILSTFFEFLDIGRTLQDRHPEIFKNGKLDISYDEFCKFFNFKFAYMTGDYVIDWFNQEMKEVFKIDVYDYEFDHSKGYSIIKNKNVELLTIRLEDLDRVFATSVSEFLGIKDIKMIKENIADTRHYAKYLDFLKKKLNIKEFLSSHFYESRYATHFYSKNEILQFKEKWKSGDEIIESEFTAFGINKENIFEGIKLWDNETGLKTMS
jgi:hypothetical protein